MANTRQEISLIHTRGLATPNKKYYRDDGQVFIGTPDRRLKVLDKAELVRFKPTLDVPASNIADALDMSIGNVNSRIDGVESTINSNNNSLLNNFLFL